jgi:hypothetical protein
MVSVKRTSSQTIFRWVTRGNRDVASLWLEWNPGFLWSMVSVRVRRGGGPMINILPPVNPIRRKWRV